MKREHVRRRLSSTPIDSLKTERLARMVVRTSGQFGWSDGPHIALDEAPVSTGKRSRSVREQFSRLPGSFDFPSNCEKSGRIFTAFSGTLRAHERMLELRNGEPDV